ncbi:hypothetical protein [Luteibacter yeojuensis]|uniref:Uncharacterized protein n=1 Tax=Luteibacter yeojuensis TaxID=345309 RepID=A0A0F3KYN8_9GAMM|nr:hypothetical protein [Luteibacter yeojuensis]KJV36400.1 hypothetical protein VI08_04560 [Luteibacter yeojuensis]
MTWAEVNLLEALSAYIAMGRVRTTRDVEGFFSALQSAFPFGGNRIAWEEVPGASIISAPAGLDPSEAFVHFVRNTLAGEDIGGELVAIGDNQVNFAILGRFDDLLEVMPLITGFPQHTYVFPFPSLDWCANLTFEDVMCFGRAPAR